MASDTGLKLVLFDFDGTLCDSASTIVRLMKQAASDIDIELPSETVIRGNIGFGVDHVALEYAQGDAEKAVVLAQRYRQLSRETYHQSAPPLDPLFEGATDCLKTLADTGYLLGVATNKSRAPLISLLDRHDVTSFFDVVMTVDDVPAKPSGEMARQAMSRTGTDRQNTLLVGDTIIDGGCAQDAGIGFIGVSWGYHPDEALVEIGALDIASTFGGLPALISKALS